MTRISPRRVVANMRQGFDLLPHLVARLWRPEYQSVLLAFKAKPDRTAGFRKCLSLEAHLDCSPVRKCHWLKMDASTMAVWDWVCLQHKPDDDWTEVEARLRAMEAMKCSSGPVLVEAVYWCAPMRTERLLPGPITDVVHVRVFRSWL